MSIEYMSWSLCKELYKDLSYPFDKSVVFTNLYTKQPQFGKIKQVASKFIHS